MAKKNGNGKNGDSVVNLGAAGAAFGTSIGAMTEPFKIGSAKPGAGGIIDAAKGSAKIKKIMKGK